MRLIPMHVIAMFSGWVTLGTACKPVDNKVEKPAKPASEVAAKPQEPAKAEPKDQSPPSRRGDDQEAAQPSFVVEVDDEASLEIETETPASIKFRVTEFGSASIGVGFISAPKGMKIVASLPEFTVEWAEPTQGNHQIKFQVRDLGLCGDAGGDEKSCRLSPQALAKAPKLEAYDVASQVFTVKVAAPKDQVPVPGGSGSGPTGGLAGLLSSLRPGGSGGGLLNSLLGFFGIDLGKDSSKKN